MPIIKIIPMPGPSGSGGGISSVEPLNLNDQNGDLLLSISKTGTGTTRIETPQDDLSLRSARDITLYAGSDGPGKVYIGWGDAVYTPNSSNQVATFGDVDEAIANSHGSITFSGVKIIGAGTAAGDGSLNGTMELVPDADLTSDQYLIIDPTSPNHIHIRAGGDQDESTADLILGGERNAVVVSDSERAVVVTARPSQTINTYPNINNVSSSNFITTMPATIQVGSTVIIDSVTYTIASVTTDDPLPDQITATITGGVFTPDTNYTFVYEEDYNNQWSFAPNGYLYGPAMGGLLVSGITNGDNDLWISSGTSVVLNGYGETGGEFLNDSSVPGNQIATVSQLPSGATGSFTSQDGKTITVTNGIITGIE